MMVRKVLCPAWVTGSEEMAGDKRFDRINVFCLDGRLESFKLAKWPQFNQGGKAKTIKFKITPETMANAGFHARPIDGSVDNACCGYCKKNLDGWGEQDVAWDEHVSHSSICPLVSLGEQVNRELSFTMANWPHSGSICPSKMAKAGFFYWPKQDKDDDTAICVQCGLALDGWEPSDDPRHEHARRRPACPFLVTGKTHSPAHFELLFASKNTDAAMREWNENAVKAKDSVTKKQQSSGKKTAKPVVSPPKFKMPVAKASANAALPTVSKAAPVVAATPKTTRKPRQSTITASTQTTRSTRRSSIRHAVSQTPSFKMPEAPKAIDTGRPSAIMNNLLPSVHATPLGKRTRQARASTIKVEPEIDHLAKALDQLRSAQSEFSIGTTELDRPLKEFLSGLISKKMAQFDSELANQLKSFEDLVRA